jgi:hypothetical protein
VYMIIVLSNTTSMRSMCLGVVGGHLEFVSGRKGELPYFCVYI